MFLTSARGVASVRRCSRSPGFTLIELLVSLAILGALANLTLPVAQVALQRTQEQELRRSLREIRVAIDAYKRAGDEGRIQKIVGASVFGDLVPERVGGV